MRKEDCLFCKIVAGEIPSAKVYEDDRVLAFEDVNPQMPVHTLIVPKNHYDNIGDGIPDDEMGQSVQAVVQTVDPADATDEFGAELLGWLRDHLSHYKCPRSVSFEAALPRTDTGKLYKQSLIDKYS